VMCITNLFSVESCCGYVLRVLSLNEECAGMLYNVYQHQCSLAFVQQVSSDVVSFAKPEQL
jgi:hypothetical protein